MNNKSSNIKRILNILKNKEVLFSLILVASIFLGTIYSYYFKAPKYNASSTLLLIPNNASEQVTSSELNLNSELISTYSNIAKEPKILNKVINNLTLDMSAEELLSNLKISNIPGTYMIKVVAESSKPKEAMNISNELSNVFLDEIKEIYRLENIGIVDKAEMPISSYNINHFKDITASFIAGVILACLVITFEYLFDNTVKTEEDIENYIEIKTLGRVPLNLERNKELIDRTNVKSYALECINTIRTNILYMTAIKTAKTILITSSREQEGKSFISSNISAAFADIDKRVLLIDADMRKGRTDKIFDVNNLYGLSDYLCAMTGNIREDLKLGKKYVIESEIPNLHILTHGTTPPNPAELLTSDNMKELIKLLKKVYDIIIIDAPPCMPVSDSIILSTIADAIVITVNSEKTKIKELIEVKKSIDIVGGNIIGAILNKVKLSEKTYKKGYYYGNCEIVKNVTKQRKIVTANKMFEEVITKLNDSDFITFEEEQEEVKENEALRDPINNNILTIEEIQEIIQKEISKINFYEEFNEINKLQSVNQEEIKKLNNIQEDKLAEMSNTISEIKERLENTADILSERVINNENVVKEFIEKEITKLEETTSTLNKKAESNEEAINKLLENQKNDKEEIQNLIKEQVITEEQIQKILDKDKLSVEQIQKIIKDEIYKLDYNKQFDKLNKMLRDLKNSYEEEEVKINEKETEKEQLNKNKKVININLLKNEKQKKKEVYSINQDISYFDLEKTASYIISFEKNNKIAL